MRVLQTSRFTKSATDFVTDNYVQTLLLLFAAIVFTFFTTKDYIPMAARFAMPWLLLMLVTVPQMRTRAILLFWVVLGLVLTVGLNFYVTANHGFMITYIGLALLISCAAQKDGEVLMQRAAVLLLSILMGLAVLQKLVSEYYMSSHLIGSYLATGQMFKVLISFVIPDWFQIVKDNLDAEKTLLADAATTAVSITIPPFVQGLAVLLTFTALASQLLLEVFILLRRRFGLWTHYAVMLFVLIIYATRNENVFLSMNLILGFALTDAQTKSARIWYVIGVVYLLTMELMGLRPGIIG